jgi:hypothetical protein
MLSQLVYVSTRNASCTDTEIEKILASCKKNNPPLQITGVLLYTDTKFIQLVEGESKIIMGLYDKIKADSRHSRPIMISYGPIKEKAFPSWHMGSRKLEGEKVDYKTNINTEDRVVIDNLLGGKEENGERILSLLKKFF